MQETYVYPVLINSQIIDDVYYVTVPGFPGGDECCTYGESFEEAIDMAEDWVALNIMEFEDDEKPIIAPDISKIKVRQDQVLVYLRVWMPLYRAETKHAYTRKNVTIPTTLAMLAEKKKINFSETLANALRNELGITETFNNKYKSKKIAA